MLGGAMVQTQKVTMIQTVTVYITWLRLCNVHCPGLLAVELLPQAADRLPIQLIELPVVELDQLPGAARVP